MCCCLTHSRPLGWARQGDGTQQYGGWRANTSRYEKFGGALDIHTKPMRIKPFRSLGTSGNLVPKSFRYSWFFLYGFLRLYFAAFHEFGMLLRIRSNCFRMPWEDFFLFFFFFLVQTCHSSTSAGLWPSELQNVPALSARLSFTAFAHSPPMLHWRGLAEEAQCWLWLMWPRTGAGGRAERSGAVSRGWGMHLHRSSESRVCPSLGDIQSVPRCHPSLLHW